MAKKVEIHKLINPAFYDSWIAEEDNIVEYGGRSSFKSSVISLKVSLEKQKDKDANVMIFRKVGRTLRDSVFNQIRWALDELGIMGEYQSYLSPLRIIHKKHGTGFYFYGVDDPMKIKSAKVGRGYVSILWFEELAEFESVEEIDIIQDTFIRQNIGRPVKTYYSFNPPRNPYAWINEWMREIKDDQGFHINHSTYEDDYWGFLSPQMKAKIDSYRLKDKDYYDWMYRGIVTGLGDTVYNAKTFNPVDFNRYRELQNRLFIFEDDPIMELYFTMDAGHQVSATTALAIGVTRMGKVILIDTYYYSPSGKVNKKPPSELSRDIMEFMDKVERELGIQARWHYIDSAEGALRNQMFSDYAIRIKPVAKKKKLVMIDMATSIFSTGRFYYLDRESNDIFIEEHKKYAYDSKTLKTAEPKVIEVDDHTCDAFQYFVVEAGRQLGLKW